MNSRIILLSLFCFAFSNPVNYNLSLVSNTVYENDNNNFGISDVWGYTDETGVEYAIFGYQYGSIILDVSTNPNSPIEVFNLLGPSNSDYYYHRDYKVYGDFLYIVNEMTGSDVGMQVVDLSPLPYNDPNYVTTYQNINQSHNLWIDNNGLAFIEHVGGDNIHIANLSNPSNPVYENTFGNLGSGCHDIFTQNNLAYVSEGWNSSFSIYDISNLDDINLITSIYPQAGGYAHNAWVTTNDNILVTTEETVGKTIKIWDISDLQNIELKGEYLGENMLAHNVHIKENLVYISHYTTGIKIVDIFNPNDPVEVAAYDTYSDNNNSTFHGCWGVYPFALNNYIYASDMQNGLFVFEFDHINAGWLEINVISENDNPYNGGYLKSHLNDKIFFMSDQKFYFGFPSGLQTFDYMFDGIIVQTIEFYIQEHDVSEFNFELPQNYLFGDINFDGTVSIFDVILLINAVLGLELNQIEFNIADINQDIILNVLDIIEIVNIILYN